ncbi:MAG: nucleotidyltransferase domain-containing protein [Cyclobacteriaceae bacterium]|nr:nucleotidyltransferase domain-containing protein [Bacteroidota bacterium]MCB9237417.1 nucleotidyltransferase domain-containing protein [Flammeovirgaceae bacterium]MCO5273086.1 nucleotidyltransferase domain-containing protein [Cyclobacteriaceae bacterium]
MELIETYKNQIQKLCENHNVKTLYSFGSVNTPRFTKESDIDLLVDFKSEDPIEYTDNYFDLKFELEKIFNRQIDLLENKAIKNPYIKESIDKTKVLVYAL